VGRRAAILACALARRGIAVTLVESGPARGVARDPRVAALDVYESAGALDYLVAGTRFRGAGGTANLWHGVTPRLHPIDFEPNPYTPRGAPWPIRYDDLEPYYPGAESELQVRGVDGAPGRRRAAIPFRAGWIPPSRTSSGCCSAAAATWPCTGCRARTVTASRCALPTATCPSSRHRRPRR